MCKVTLPERIIATRYRILPIDWNDSLCFRLELIGCHIIGKILNFLNERWTKCHAFRGSETGLKTISRTTRARDFEKNAIRVLYTHPRARAPSHENVTHS